MTPPESANRELSVVDIGILVMDAVMLLHERGHERLRILPGMSPSGVHWRVAVAPVDMFNGDQGHLHLTSHAQALVYSTAADREVAGREVDAATTREQMADLILTALPDSGLGTDAEYVRWYAELMRLVHRHRALPIAYADHFGPEKGWEVGWGSGIRVRVPPTAGDSSQQQGEQTEWGHTTFHGTVASFKRYTGAYWRVVVQNVGRSFKKSVGHCQHCGATDISLEAAHIHGRERIRIIHELLGSTQPQSPVTVALGAFEADFRAEHAPPEKSLLALCKACHKVYDSKVDGIPAGEVDPGEPLATTTEQRPLPITLHPPGEDRFKAAVLVTRRAWLDVHFVDGRVERRVWRADKLDEGSRVMSNLRSRKEFRPGTWQAAGIVAVHVSVAPQGTA